MAPFSRTCLAFLVAVTAGVGCHSSAVCVSNGDHPMDCCQDDAYCTNHFGQEYPFCINPGQHGVCSECARDVDCQSDQHCDIDRWDYGGCVDD